MIEEAIIKAYALIGLILIIGLPVKAVVWYLWYFTSEEERDAN